MIPINDWNELNYWFSCITLNGSVKPLDIILALEEENIELSPICKHMHLQPSYYSECDFISQCEGSSVSEKLFEGGVCLLSDTKMIEGDLFRKVNIIKGI